MKPVRIQLPPPPFAACRCRCRCRSALPGALGRCDNQGNFPNALAHKNVGFILPTKYGAALLLLPHTMIAGSHSHRSRRHPKSTNVFTISVIIVRFFL